MIIIRIYDRNFNHIDSIIWSQYKMNDIYSMIFCLQQAFKYSRAKYGINIYNFSLLETADSQDYRFVKVLMKNG